MEKALVTCQGRTSEGILALAACTQLYQLSLSPFQRDLFITIIFLSSQSSQFWTLLQNSCEQGAGTLPGPHA